jgi:hypothetical protein
MEGSAKRWKEWVEEPRPESVPLPGDWKRLPAFDRLLILRCIRPDRTSEALQSIVAELVGPAHAAFSAWLPAGRLGC